MITAPYNFVPLSDKVFFPDWGKDISMDIPFEDGEDGIITLTIENKSPLFVRDGHSSNEKTEWSCHVLDNNGNKNYFIPGSSLKGCFRSVLEILSFSKMNRFNNDSFGYRSFTTQIKGVTYSSDIKRAKYCGWLHKDGDNYFISECTKGIQKIKHIQIAHNFKEFNPGQDHQTAEIKQKSLCNGNPLYPTINVKEGEVKYSENKQERVVPEGEYQIVCTGYMRGKRIEYLFSTDRESKEIKVDKEVFQSFDSVHGHTPYYAGLNGKDGFLKGLLLKGEEIPVFFEKDKEGKIVTMGITRMYRYPFKNTVKDGVYGTHFAEDKMDLTECLFGYIHSNNQLKGRIHIGNAFCQETISDNECCLQQGVLGQPRASYYPLYLQQKEGQSIVNYSSSDATIAGRKRYRVSKDFNTLPLGKGNGNEKLLVHFRPIPAKNTFICKVRVHNLKKSEIGALLSAITFNQTGGTYHNIGLAKAFGYGIISCSASLSSHFKFSIDEYVKAFNEEISNFLQFNGSRICLQDCLNKLVSIASATHTPSDMKQMDFNECEFYKEDKNFDTLKDSSKLLNIPINEADILEKRQKERRAKEEAEEAEKAQKKGQLDSIMQEAENLAIENKYDEAIEKYKLYQELSGENISYKIDACLSKKQAVLDMQNADITDTLTISSLGAYLGKLKKWIGSHENTLSPEDEQKAFALLQANIGKMKDAKGKLKELPKILGEGKGKEWLNKLSL